MRLVQGGHGHLAPRQLGHAVAPVQIVSYARVPADIGIPSIGQRVSRNSKQVPLLPEATREGAHEGHVLAQAHAGEVVRRLRAAQGEQRLEAQALAVGRHAKARHARGPHVHVEGVGTEAGVVEEREEEIVDEGFELLLAQLE